MTAQPSTSRILRALAHAWRMTNPWSPSVRDARDKPVPLYRIDLRPYRPGDRNDLPQPAFDRIRSSLIVNRALMGPRPWAILIVSALWVWCLIVMVWALPPGRRLPWYFWTLALSVAVYIASAFTYRSRIPKVGRDHIAAAMLAERRCPSCAYDLSATVPDPDGCTVCPECGAAWRLPTNPLSCPS